jgi:hypothetical protein
MSYQRRHYISVCCKSSSLTDSIENSFASRRARSDISAFSGFQENKVEDKIIDSSIGSTRFGFRGRSILIVFVRYEVAGN